MSAEFDQGGSADEIVSMVDVLDEESRMQEDASAVLGDSDEQNCTYSSGYVKRQALYACATCTPTEPAGICLACSYNCHDGHNLYELYTKRFFRCDCGNNKFGDNKCKLDPVKENFNSKNCYNQNFKGTYCTCARPYPDPDDEIEDEMIQCIVCEDWYHGRHLNVEPPDHEDFNEMTCTSCMYKHPFLWAYQLSCHDIAVLSKSVDGDTKVDVGGGKEGTPTKTQTQTVVKGETNTPLSADSLGTASVNSSSDAVTAESEPPTKRMKSEHGSCEDNTADSKHEPCLLRDLQKREVTVMNHATFWSDGWRPKLCRCSQCLKMYKEEGVEFLLDKEDTIYEYEERGRRKAATPSESELEQSALASMNHVQKIEVIQGYNKMKTALSTYLQSFAENGKVVTKEDIQSFFKNLQRKRKSQMPLLQYSCK